MKKLLMFGMLGALALPAMAQSWRQFDYNRDGLVAFSELRAGGIRVDGRIRALDRNNDRLLSRRELRGISLNSYAYQQPYYQQYYVNNNPGCHWSTLDTNRNGVLEAYELNDAGFNTNRNYNMYTIDLNRDGYIDDYEQRAAYNNRVNTGDIFWNLLQVLPGLLNR